MGLLVRNHDQASRSGAWRNLHLLASFDRLKLGEQSAVVLSITSRRNRTNATQLKFSFAERARRSVSVTGATAP
jgi:predicted Mrr-cat superfamily restriction endonuclease